MVSVKESKLCKALKNHCNTNNPSLNAFAESLDFLVDPEFRWKYWFDLIKEAMMREDEENKEKAAHFASLMIENITKRERKFVGLRIGLKNREFSKTFGKSIVKAFGEEGEKLLTYDYNQFVESIQETYGKINEQIEELESGQQKLSDYSEWLAYNYSYFEYKDYIEIPGQYENDQEPLVDNHIKIAGFQKNVLTLASIRKPKKLTINGSNEKEYDLLVKGGEDLRLDQRVQQVFKIMNK